MLYISARIPLNWFAASRARDTIAKKLYTLLFESIVCYINRAWTNNTQTNQTSNITIIDIAGFGKSIRVNMNNYNNL